MCRFRSAVDHIVTLVCIDDVSASTGQENVVSAAAGECISTIVADDDLVCSCTANIVRVLNVGYVAFAGLDAVGGKIVESTTRAAVSSIRPSRQTRSPWCDRQTVRTHR